MGKCCIPGCKNSRERIPGLTFHQIPSSEPWRALWLEVLSKHGVKVFTEWTLVCGEHFTHEDYKMTARKNFLLPSAIPSVFNVSSSSGYVPKKRGRKPKSQLQPQMAVLRSLVASEESDPADDDDGGPRRTGRLRKRKVFTDMVVYMPKPASDLEDPGQFGNDENSGIVRNTVSVTLQDIAAEDDERDLDTPSGVHPVMLKVGVAKEPDTQTEEHQQSLAPSVPKEHADPSANPLPPKNLNVIVFSSQPQASTKQGGGESSLADAELLPRPKRRCCQIQTQRLLFYKSVIVKLRKRVLALEANLQEKEQELAALGASRF